MDQAREFEAPDGRLITSATTWVKKLHLYRDRCQNLWDGAAKGAVDKWFLTSLMPSLREAYSRRASDQEPLGIRDIPNLNLAESRTVGMEEASASPDSLVRRELPTGMDLKLADFRRKRTSERPLSLAPSKWPTRSSCAYGSNFGLKGKLLSSSLWVTIYHLGRNLPEKTRLLLLQTLFHSTTLSLGPTLRSHKLRQILENLPRCRGRQRPPRVFSKVSCVSAEVKGGRMSWSQSMVVPAIRFARSSPSLPAKRFRDRLGVVSGSSQISLSILFHVHDLSGESLNSKQVAVSLTEDVTTEPCSNAAKRAWTNFPGPNIPS
jgi:hypothetical protein